MQLVHHKFTTTKHNSSVGEWTWLINNDTNDNYVIKT